MEISEERLKELMEEAVRSALNSNCPLSDGTKDEVGHFFGRIKDIGEGNLSIGIERTTKAIEWIARIREFGSRTGAKIGEKIILIVVLGGLGILSTIFGKGILVWIRDILIK